jgi:hypothetical protein
MGTINGRSPFTTDSENEALLLGQAFLAVTTVMALALAAAVQERKDAEIRFQDIAERLVNKRTAELLHTQARLRTMAQALTLTEQRERKRMAAELHDYLAQLLVLGKMKLAQTHAQIGTRGPVASVLEEIEHGQGARLYGHSSRVEPPVLHGDRSADGARWLADQMKKHRRQSCGSVLELPLTENQAIFVCSARSYSSMSRNCRDR